MPLRIAGRLTSVFGLSLIVVLGTATLRGERDAPAPNTRDPFVGSWRLVSLEHTGPDGKIDKPECSGQFVFTGDGHATVQVMYVNAQGSSTQYAAGGYEATFGRYTVDDHAHTFTFHVEGALVRTLVGQDLPRRYAFAGNQLTVGPVNKAEGWRVVWVRE